MMPISLAKSGSRGSAPQFRQDSQLWQKAWGISLQAPKPFRVPDWKIDGTNRHEMQRQRAEGDEERPGDIPGDAQHEITVAFRDNPGAHGDRFPFVAGCAPCVE